MTYDALIIGAGAAGLMCAGEAVKRGRQVLVLEHNREPGAKILISGGGRCNFTNLHVAPERFISANPHFARSALARYTAQDFLRLVERYGIAYYEKTLGQLFCEGAGSARKIVDLLMVECAGADVRLGVRVRDVRRGEGFVVETDAGDFTARSVVLASGGLSIPKLGASDLAYRIARKFGLKLIATRPGLVPLTFGAADLARMAPLSGVSAEAVVRAGRAAFREALLFTHRGLSGPAILQASSYRAEGEPIVIDLLPDADGGDLLCAAKRARPKAQLKTVLGEHFSARLAEMLAADASPAPLADFKDESLRAIGRALNAWSVTPTGEEGYAKAEVTVGGIDTAALSQKTMEARAVPGLYAIGEAVDVTGWLGGYNFQWAWASGWCAGQAV